MCASSAVSASSQLTTQLMQQLLRAQPDRTAIVQSAIEQQSDALADQIAQLGAATQDGSLDITA